MAPLVLSVASAASMLAMLPGALAGFNPASSSNVAVYWGKQLKYRFTLEVESKLETGQNSYNQGSGPFAQQRLSYYCSSE